jgi:methylmalonyl-CoA mutase N-terminal domain/subunit
VQVALRTQQVIADESGVADTVDPLGGSYYIEWLTNHIENEAMRYIDEIDKIGGTMKAIEMGYIQKAIASSAYSYQKAVDSCERVIVGVNKFTTEEETLPEILEIDIETERKQVERLERLKKERDNQKVNEVLSKVRDVARSDKNVMPILIEAVKAYATVGEISEALRDVFGEYREPNIL